VGITVVASSISLMPACIRSLFTVAATFSIFSLALDSTAPSTKNWLRSVDFADHELWGRRYRLPTPPLAAKSALIAQSCQSLQSSLVVSLA
jgi:hypothetical protein